MEEQRGGRRNEQTVGGAAQGSEGVTRLAEEQRQGSRRQPRLAEGDAGRTEAPAHAAEKREPQASAQVFISYSGKDRAAADTVLHALEAQRIRCWYAPRDIPAGSNYMGTINRAIQNSDLFLVVISANANHSIDMKKEVSLANHRRLPIIPFRIDSTILDDDWTFELSMHQYVDGSKNVAGALPILVSEVQSALPNRRHTELRSVSGAEGWAAKLRRVFRGSG